MGDKKIENCDHQITSDVEKFAEVAAAMSRSHLGVFLPSVFPLTERPAPSSTSPFPLRPVLTKAQFPLRPVPNLPRSHLGTARSHLGVLLRALAIAQAARRLCRVLRRALHRPGPVPTYPFPLTHYHSPVPAYPVELSIVQVAHATAHATCHATCRATGHAIWHATCRAASHRMREYSRPPRLKPLLGATYVCVRAAFPCRSQLAAFACVPLCPDPT